MQNSHTAKTPPLFVDLHDLRASALSPSVRADLGIAMPEWVQSDALAAMLSVWETELAREAQAAAMGQPVRAYVRPLERPFDERPSAAIPFVDLPYGLQLLLGEHATTQWYRAAEEEQATGAGRAMHGLATETAGLVRSTWTRRTVRVRDLGPVLASAWAMHHLWWDSPLPYAFSAPSGAQYSALFEQGVFSGTPFVTYDGAVHTQLVPFFLAALRFAPDAEVRWLEGQSGATDLAELPEPRYPAYAWMPAGDRLQRQDDLIPDVGERQRLAARFTRARSAGTRDRRAMLIDQLWAQGTGAAPAAPYTEASVRYAATLPYRLPAPTLEAQLAWRPASAVRDGEGGGQLARLLPGAWRADALPATVELHGELVATDGARLAASLLTLYLPEMKGLLAQLR